MSEKVSLEQEYLATATRYFDETQELKAEVKRLRGLIADFIKNINVNDLLDRLKG